MKRILTRNIPAVLAVLWLTAGVALAEMVDNPMYLHWARFKPGSYVTMKVTTKTAAMTNESEQTYTLKSITPEKAILETRMTAISGGNRTTMPPSTMEIPARVEKGKAVSVTGVKGSGKVIGQGEEVLTIKDKKVKTKWVKSTAEYSGTKSEVTVWTSNDIPNMTARSINKSSGAAQMTMEQIIIDFKADKK